MGMLHITSLRMHVCLYSNLKGLRFSKARRHLHTTYDSIASIGPTQFPDFSLHYWSYLQSSIRFSQSLTRNVESLLLPLQKSNPFEFLFKLTIPDTYFTIWNPSALLATRLPLLCNPKSYLTFRSTHAYTRTFTPSRQQQILYNISTRQYVYDTSICTCCSLPASEHFFPSSSSPRRVFYLKSNNTISVWRTRVYIQQTIRETRFHLRRKSQIRAGFCLTTYIDGCLLQENADIRYRLQCETIHENFIQTTVLLHIVYYVADHLFICSYVICDNRRYPFSIGGRKNAGHHLSAFFATSAHTATGLSLNAKSLISDNLFFNSRRVSFR